MQLLIDNRHKLEYSVNNRNSSAVDCAVMKTPLFLNFLKRSQAKSNLIVDFEIFMFWEINFGLYSIAFPPVNSVQSALNWKEEFNSFWTGNLLIWKKRVLSNLLKSFFFLQETAPQIFHTASNWLTLGGHFTHFHSFVTAQYCYLTIIDIMRNLEKHRCFYYHFHVP